MLHQSKNESTRYDPGYSGRGIEFLELPEAIQAIRGRPKVFIGSTDQRGLHALLASIVEGLLWHYRVLQASLDQVTIRLEQDGSATMTCQGSKLSETFLEQSPQNLLRDFQVTYRYTPLLMIANALSEQLGVSVRGSGTQWRSFVFEQGLLREDGFHRIPPGENCDIWLRIFPDFTILDLGAFNYEQTQEALRFVRARSRSRELVMEHYGFAQFEKFPFRQRWPLCRIEEYPR